MDDPESRVPVRTFRMFDLHPPTRHLPDETTTGLFPRQRGRKRP
jgi:hypothetical protein